MPIRGVLFDKGETLTRDVRFDVAAGLSRLAGELALPDAPKRDALVSSGLALRDEILPRRDVCDLEITCGQFLRTVLARNGMFGEWSDSELERPFFHGAVTAEAEPGAEAALRSLRARGIRTGMLSNTFFSHELLAEEMKTIGLYALLDVFVCSSSYGVRKPHPLLFQIALNRLGTTPAETLLVGNHARDDVAGANHSGLVSVWYNPNGLARPQGIAPRYEIRRLLDVPAIVEGPHEQT